MHYLVISLNLSIKETVHKSKNTKSINLLTVADKIFVIFIDSDEEVDHVF